MSFQGRLITAFGTALALLTVIATLTYLQLRQDAADRSWVEHTHSIIDRVNTLQADLASAVTNQRSYVTTREKTYLKEYQGFNQSLQFDLADLRQMTADNASQQQTLDKLAPLIARRINNLQERIAVFQSGGVQPEATPTGAQATRDINEQIRDLMSGITQTEQELLKRRLAAASVSTRQLGRVIVAGNLLALGVLLAASILIYSEMRKRKLAEGTLSESEERLRLILAGVKDYSILMLDPHGIITTWNAGAENLKGYSAQEIIGQHFSRFYLPEDVEAGKPQYELEVATEKGRFEDEGWRVRKDGSRFWANVIITALRDEEGRLRGFGKVSRDMTLRKKAEQEILERSLQLEVANKELEAFSYSVSHDLRAPLRSIDGFSQALLEDYADALDAGAKEYLNRVRAATQRMSTLIDDLLSLSRVTRTDMSREKVDLSAIATTISAELADHEPNRNVRFVIAKGLVAEGDTELLRIVMQNLLGNAWKYTSKHTSAEIQFGRDHQGNSEPYFIRDDGAGFNPSHSSRLFGAFQRLHGAAEFPGTGIGLATVQRIVHRHGGQIWAEGTVEKGATFYFTL